LYPEEKGKEKDGKKIKNGQKESFPKDAKAVGFPGGYPGISR